MGDSKIILFYENKSRHVRGYFYITVVSQIAYNPLAGSKPGSYNAIQKNENNQL